MTFYDFLFPFFQIKGAAAVAQNRFSVHFPPVSTKRGHRPFFRFLGYRCCPQYSIEAGYQSKELQFVGEWWDVKWKF